MFLSRDGPLILKGSRHRPALTTHDTPDSPPDGDAAVTRALGRQDR
jgi:hypothetical protein